MSFNLEYVLIQLHNPFLLSPRAFGSLRHYKNPYNTKSKQNFFVFW